LEVFESGNFSSAYPRATKVRAFEAAFAEYAGSKHAVAFNSCTTAQHASLVIAGVQPGDEVIVSPLTFAAPAYTVFMVGATPIFADADDNTINMDPEKVAEKITPRTRAIVPVHWFGHPVAMDEIFELAAQHDLTVIEDCAHGFGTVYRGRKAGTMGLMGCWSLQETKMLTAAGEGGVLTTHDDGVALLAQSIADHGKAKGAEAGDSPHPIIVRLGNNYRLSEIQAAFALAQVRKADQIRTDRKSHVEYLDDALLDVEGLKRPKPWPDVELSYAYYPLRFDEDHFRVDLEQISAALEAEGIGNNMLAHHERPYVHPLFVERCGPVDLPIADRIARELVILPLWPDLTRDDLDDILEAVMKVVTAYRR
jgi:dTDP-4-amino-4,6-dideoxygalactose transaminase